MTGEGRLKEAKRAASERRNEVPVQTEERPVSPKKEKVREELKEKEREVGSLKAEVARLEGLLKEQLGRSRGIYS